MKKIFSFSAFFLVVASYAQLNISVGSQKLSINGNKKGSSNQVSSDSKNKDHNKPAKADTGRKILWQFLYTSYMSDNWAVNEYETEKLTDKKYFLDKHRNGLLNPYCPIKKTTETNNLRRFVIDYPELQPYMQQPDKLGKIYFSTEQGKASVSNNRNRFTTADMVYATMVVNGTGLSQTFQLPQTASVFGKDEPLNAIRLAIQLFDAVTGAFVGGSSLLNMGDNLLLYPAEMNTLQLQFDLRPAPEKTYSVFGENVNWKSSSTSGGKLLDHLIKSLKKEGDYRVVVCISNPYAAKDGFGNELKNQWNQAFGEFTLTVHEADLAKMKTDAKLIANRVYEITHTTSLPEAFTKTTNSPDPSLSLSALKTLIQNSYGSNYIIQKVVFDNIGGNGWRIETNSLGIPLEKHLNRQVLFTYTNKADGKCYVAGMVPRRKYEGGGRYAAISLSTGRFETMLINCNLIK